MQTCGIKFLLVIQVLSNIHTNLMLLPVFVKQRERKRRNSDRSEDGYHSDGDFPEQDYRREPGEEKKSKTIMLWGLSPHVTEDDVSLIFLPQLGSLCLVFSVFHFFCIKKRF